MQHSRGRHVVDLDDDDEDSWDSLERSRNIDAYQGRSLDREDHDIWERDRTQYDVWDRLDGPRRMVDYRDLSENEEEDYIYRRPIKPPRDARALLSRENPGAGTRRRDTTVRGQDLSKLEEERSHLEKTRKPVDYGDLEDFRTDAVVRKTVNCFTGRHYTVEIH